MLLVVHPIKKFTFHGTWMWIFMFTRACHLYISRARLIQSICTDPIALRSILNYLPTYVLVFKVVSFLQVSPPILCISLFCMCHMPSPSHPPQFDHLNIWWGVHIMKLFTVQFSPVPFHLLSLRPIYIFLSTLFSNISACVLPEVWKTKFMLTKNSRQSRSSIYFKLHVLR